MIWTLEERKKYRNNKKKEYSFHITTKLGLFRPEIVDKELGILLVYIPFKEDNICLWMFKTIKDHDKFKEYIKENMK